MSVGGGGEREDKWSSSRVQKEENTQTTRKRIKPNISQRRIEIKMTLSNSTGGKRKGRRNYKE